MKTGPNLALTVALALSCGAALAASAEERAALLDIETGAGYDTNPTRAPRESYFDERNQIGVNPQENGTFFLPLRILGHYRPGDGERSFLARFQFRGDFFSGSDASNADELYARISPGFEWRSRGEGRKESRFHTTPFASYNKELYYDRDSGDDFGNGSSDVTDRYTYLATGAEIDYERRAARRVEFSLGAAFEQRDYDDVGSLSSFDQERYRFEGDFDFDLGRRLDLILDYGYTVHDYDERPSRSLDGRALLTNPPREYTYHAWGTALRTRFGESWTLYLDYDRTTRADDFEGYHDYVQDTFGLRLLFGGERWRFRIAPEVWMRDYDEALVFDLPGNAQLAYDTLELDVRAERALRGPLSFVIDLTYRDEDCEDPRYAYVREQMMAGIRWRPER